MKFEDFLMQPSDPEKQRRVDLAEEVEKLQGDLDAELKLSKILQCALQGPVHSCSCVSKLIPSKVQMLFEELAMVEEEIIWLERKVDELKLSLYQEKKKTEDWESLKARQRLRQKKQLCNGLGSQTEVSCRLVLRSQDFKEDGKCKISRERRASFSSPMDTQSLSSMKSSGKHLPCLQTECSQKKPKPQPFRPTNWY